MIMCSFSRQRGEQSGHRAGIFLVFVKHNEGTARLVHCHTAPLTIGYFWGKYGAASLPLHLTVYAQSICTTNS